MNKIRIGNYLKSIRNAKSMTREDLSGVFNNNFGKEVSITAISEWEAGKFLPSIENLKALSKIYGKTLDEILDGEDEKKDDSVETYFIPDANWISKPYNYSCDIYSKHHHQIIKVRTRFKELIVKYISDDITENEFNEMFFLLSNYYSLSDYASSLGNLIKPTKINTFLHSLNRIKNRFHDKSIDEIYWEVQKTFVEKEIIQFSFQSEMSKLRTDSHIKDRFSTLETWQKDLLLSEFQRHEPSYSHLTEPTRKQIETDSFDEELIKQDIKALIENGACINHNYLQTTVKTVNKYRIIDRLEELYDSTMKPIRIATQKNDMQNQRKIIIIKNNKKNRFIRYFYNRLSPTGLPTFSSNAAYKNMNQFYSWFADSENIDEEIYLKIAQEAHIDINRNSKNWITKINSTYHLDEIIRDFHIEETKIQKAKEEILGLYSKLKHGEKDFETVDSYDLISENTSFNSFGKMVNEKLSFSDFNYGRDYELTRELLENLPKLSLSQIRSKYLKTEVITR